MSVFFIICIAALMISVVGVLIIGIISMVKGGDFNKKYGNKLMRLRVTLQGVAMAMLALAYLTHSR